MKKVDAQLARQVLAATHDAWSKGDLERMLVHFDDELTYWCNVGAIDGQPFTIDGKQGLRTLLQSVLSVAESASKISFFQFEDGIARSTVQAYVRHRRTGHEISGTFRQIVTYRGKRIVKLEEFHEAAKMSAFWRMVTVDDGDDSYSGE